VQGRSKALVKGLLPKATVLARNKALVKGLLPKATVLARNKAKVQESQVNTVKG